MDQMLAESCTKAFALIPEDRQPNYDSYLSALVKYFVDPPQVIPWKDYFMPPEFVMAQYAHDKWQPRNGDIMVASYPKTGTTWVREIVRQIIYRNDTSLLKKTNISLPMFAYLEVGPKEKFQVIDNFPMDRRVLGTHLPAPLVNFENFRKNGAKVIYVIRNPKDQLVSWYNFRMDFPFIDKEPFNKMFPRNKKEFFDLAIAGKQHNYAKDGEGYAEHVRDWYKHKHEDNLLVVYYEDMKENLFGEVRKIAEFIGENLSEEEVKHVANQTSLNKMKGPNDDQKALKLVRKGQVGNWKDHLTVAQSELIDSKVKKILGDIDIKLRYEL